jgi:hypothetical protein
MRGRWPGGVALVVAMTAVIAGHGLFRAPASGVAVPVDLPATPRVGACVLYLPDPAADLDSAVAYRNVAFGPCKGVLAGEIASVTPGRRTVADGSIGALMGTSGDCWAAASRYVGLSRVGDLAGSADADPTGDARGRVAWRPELQVRGQLVGADVLQTAAGRDWSACVVRPENLDVYLGSVRGALRNGAAPAPYGDCSVSTDLTLSSSVDCANPHATERLGWAAVPSGSVSAKELTESCLEFARLLLRTGDPTFGGILHIVTHTAGPTTCAAIVRGSARLTGSLIGIGSRPLPLTT